MPFRLSPLRVREEFVRVRVESLLDGSWQTAGHLTFFHDDWLAFRSALQGRVDVIEVLSWPLPDGGSLGGQSSVGAADARSAERLP